MISIIILSVNQAKLTIKCFESIRINTKIPYEIIWVDNGSNSNEFNTIFSYVKKNNLPVKLVKFNKNKGFVKGVNSTIPYINTSSEYIILLNNDTEIGSKTFEKLIRPLSLDKSIGATGTITQSKIAWQSWNSLNKRWPKLKLPKWEGNIKSYVSKLDKINKNKCIDIGRLPLAFFCTAFRKDVFVNKLGGLDPDIDNGLGDDDLACIKLRSMGYKLVLVLDAFVLHHHRTTFKALGISVDNLRRKNVKTIREKVKKLGTR